MASKSVPVKLSELKAGDKIQFDNLKFVPAEGTVLHATEFEFTYKLDAFEKEGDPRYTYVVRFKRNV